MSKIETLRCDICGKPYYSDESKLKSEIAMRTRNEEEGTYKTYEHICPKCETNIHNYLSRPDLFDIWERKLDDKLKQRNTLESCLAKIHNHVAPFSSYWERSNDVEYFRSQTDFILNEIKGLEERQEQTDASRLCWKLWCIAFISFSITFTILRIFG